MKKFKCYDCEKVFKAETKEELLNALYTHYIDKHKKIMTESSKEEKEAWMKKFEKDWASTVEI